MNGKKVFLMLFVCFMLVGAMGLVDAKKKTYDSLTQTVNLDSSFLGIKTGVSATDWDNKLNYEQDTKTIIVKNTFGLGRDLIKAQLTDNFCTGGRFCEADKTIELFEEGVLIEDFKTLRLDDFSKEEQNIRWYKLEYFGIVEDFETQCTYKNITTNGTYEEQICEQIKTGTHNDWIQFKEGDVFSKGIYQVRTTGEIKPGRVYDWQIKIEGKWTTPWAIWGNISTGDDAEVILNSPVNGSVSLTNLVTFNVTANVTGGATLVNMSLFTNETGNWEIRLDTFVNGDSSPDISDLIYSNNNFDLSTESTNPFQLKLKPDGTKLYIFDKISFIIYQYSLSTPWNITTASYDSKFKTVNTQDTEPRDFWIKPDGTKIYILGGTNHAIYQYTLTTPWDISTYTYDSKSKVSETNLRFIYLTPDGTKLWVGCDNNKGIYQHILSTPWDISTAGVSSNAITFGTKLNAPNSLMVSSDGKSIYPNGLVNKKMFEWNLSTAYDLSTGTFVNEYAMAEDSTPTGTAIGTNNVIYQLGDTTDTAYQYILPSRERTITDDIIWNVQACDSDGDCGFAPANYSLFLDTTAPTISITSPNETFDYGKVNKSLDFNITVTDTNLDTCWYDYNSTNITFSCTTGVKATENITQNANNYSVTVYANDTLNNVNSTSVNWNYRVFENNLTYNDQVVETSNQDFNISVTHDSSIWNSITSKIEYNGTNYSATQFGTGDTLIFSRTLEIPAITTSTENKSFYWYFTLTNGTGAYDFRSSEYTQNVSEIDIHLCGTEETAYLRFFTNDSENPFPALNATFKSAWNIGSLGGSGLLANYSFEDLTEVNNTWEFCITPNETEYTLTVDVEVDATDFAKNFYYIQEEDYTDNSTTNITLYLLNDTAATPTILRTRNTAQNRLTNVLIYIDVFDVGTNDYYTVGMAKTNENGEDVVYLNWYETLYRFRLFQDGLNTLTTNNTKIFETPKIFEIGEDFTYSFDKFDNIIHTLVYDNATNIFTLIFDTNDASIESGCLRVIKRNPTNDTEICLTCVESESATINCDVSTYGNGTFIAAFYATGSFSLVDLLSIVEGSSFADQVFDMLDKDDAAFYSIILALIVVAMFLITPVLGIIGAIIGLIFVTSLGFATISYAYFMGIIILGVVIIWSLKK